MDLGPVSFLARSPNRVDTLVALEAGPATRSALQAETGIPRATLSRILADFRERELAERDGHEFSITPLGGLLVTELRSLSDSIEAVRELQTLEPWLPLSELGIEVGDLAEASVTLPTPVEPLAPVRRTAEVLASSERVRGLCNNVVPENLQALRGAVVEGRLAVEVVVTDDAFDAVAADPAVSGLVGEMLATGRLDLSVCTAALPHLAILADGSVLLVVADDEGAIRGTVETESEAAQSWFAEAFDTYRLDAERVVPEVLTT